MCQESITYRMVLLMFFLQLLCVFRVYSIWFLKWNVRIVVIFGSGGPSILLDGKKIMMVGQENTSENLVQV
jgi:hypothetical protein